MKKFGLVEEAEKAKKLPKEEKIQLANAITEAGGVDVDPEALTPKNVEAAVKQEPTGTKKEMDTQRMLFTALGASLPTLIGAAFGGAEGGAIGAQAGGKFASDVSAGYAAEKKEAKEAEAAAAAKAKEAKEFGFKEAELDIKKAEAGIKGTERKFKNVQDLRKEYEGHPVTKASREVVSAFGKVKAAAESPSAAGDLSLLTSYMKMLDPGSSVKDNEFANAQNAGGVPQKVVAAYNNALTGTRLTEDQRKDFINQASNLYKSQLVQQKALNDGFTAQAIKYELDPADVLFGGMEENKAPQFPRTVINPKTNQQAVVQSAEELKEAMEEGFQ